MSSAAPTTVFDCSRLVRVFEACFGRTENTSLVAGAEEPLYLPAGEGRARNLLYFREDYFASALHECAHWCIAGAERRRQRDFGYWYAPEGRNQAQQRAFEAVEVKPQALEWLFSLACDYRFRISVDNFADDGRLPDSRDFCHAVTDRARRWQRAGLPSRASRFFNALAHEFGTGLSLADVALDPESIA